MLRWQGKREPLYRDMWVRAMDDMAAQLVFRSGGQRFLGGRFGCAALHAKMTAFLRMSSDTAKQTAEAEAWFAL